MSEPASPRPVEYYNPRPLILGLCFFWGVVIGFCLFYFSPPKNLSVQTTQQTTTDFTPAGPTRTLEERRNQGIPNSSSVDTTVNMPVRRGFESLDLVPPIVVLTTEGGLTGKTARPLSPSTTRQTPTAILPEIPGVPVTPVAPAEPPLPDLMP